MAAQWEILMVFLGYIVLMTSLAFNHFVVRFTFNGLFLGDKLFLILCNFFDTNYKKKLIGSTLVGKQYFETFW